jgi:SNF2 family DNA or RNA helicase
MQQITEPITIKVVSGQYLVPLTITPKENRLWLGFRYNKTLLEEVRSFEGRKWHGYDDKPIKQWSVLNSEHNLFRLAWLARKDKNLDWGNPYARYDAPLLDVEFERPLYDHQKHMVNHILTRHYCILACEMGTGKTLAFYEALERVGIENDYTDCWYIGPKSGVKAVSRERVKWEVALQPRMFTYNALVKELTNWNPKHRPPRFLVFDESSQVKTPTAQRSQAADHLASAVREYWGDDGFVVEMSGSPAPRTPVDWWNQCHIAQPGFLKEGDVHSFKKRLCLVEERQTASGGVYPHIVTWLDDPNKCAVCSLLRLDPVHNDVHNEKFHTFKKSINEVGNLYDRMKGLVLVQFKKDCLDLPEKIYETVKIKPTVEILRAAKLITKTSARTIEALIRLRELSDGFQYENVPTGETETCEVCHGVGHIMVPMLPEQEEFDVVDPTDQPLPESFTVEKKVMCDNCGGSGKTKIMKRVTTEVGTPKDEQFIEDLKDHEEVGRFIVWGGFTGTLDRLVRLAHQHGWYTLRVDGKGYNGQDHTGATLDADILLDAMDGSHPRFKEYRETYKKLCFVGHPKAGGMALTLTAAPTMAFFSNDFSGEARFQASERHHRAGMDLNRAARIRDYIHLPSDQLVLDNLLKKKKLQDLAMGELNTIINSAMEALRDG